ncbi:MuDR family transposase [Trifolium repens]|nr:MuDR family transposase [Trifolium repens]
MLSLKWRMQNAWEDFGNFRLIASTIPFCPSDKNIICGMHSIFTSSALCNSDMNHVQLSSFSTSTTAKASGNNPPSASKEVAERTVLRYLLFSWIPPRATMGKQPLTKP